MHKRKPYFARFLALLLSTTTVFGSVPVSASSVSGSSALESADSSNTSEDASDSRKSSSEDELKDSDTSDSSGSSQNPDSSNSSGSSDSSGDIQNPDSSNSSGDIQNPDNSDSPVIPRIQIHPIKTTAKKNRKFLIQKFILSLFRITVMPSCLKAMDTLE